MGCSSKQNHSLTNFRRLRLTLDFAPQSGGGALARQLVTHESDAPFVEQVEPFSARRLAHEPQARETALDGVATPANATRFVIAWVLTSKHPPCVRRPGGFSNGASCDGARLLTVARLVATNQTGHSNQ